METEERNMSDTRTCREERLKIRNAATIEELRGITQSLNLGRFPVLPTPADIAAYSDVDLSLMEAILKRYRKLNEQFMRGRPAVMKRRKWLADKRVKQNHWVPGERAVDGAGRVADSISRGVPDSRMQR